MAEEKNLDQEPEDTTVSQETDAQTSEETSGDTEETTEATENGAEEAEEVEEASGEDSKKKKKDKKDEQIEERTDKVKRQMAEFENCRKRSEKEKTQMYEIGAKSALEKILPVVDNFERGLGAVSEEEKEEPFVQGMDMVYKQLLNELDAIGVKAIEAVGNEFDPEYHNAVMQVESEEYESGVVAQELQKGYMYRDTVVRHSMVAVVQ